MNCTSNLCIPFSSYIQLKLRGTVLIFVGWVYTIFLGDPHLLVIHCHVFVTRDGVRIGNYT